VGLLQGEVAGKVIVSARQMPAVGGIWLRSINAAMVGKAMSEPYIRASNLSKVFKSGAADLVVFSNLGFEVYRGEMLALVGESGAGKSTLLHLLGGLDRPSTGTIYYGNRSITDLGDAEQADFRNREIGFVWQIHYLLPEFTALENVMMPLSIRGWARERAAVDALAKLDDVGLRARASHRAGELSGGEQQRVVLARALVGKPSVLLADEPTGNLDFRTGGMIFDLLSDLHRSYSLTSVLVTHNLAFARRCDRVLSLENGGIAPLLGAGLTPLWGPSTPGLRIGEHTNRYEA
jgi:lipoprotein-releasing system ATP-binding protein